jgi:hypothetical protein
MLMHTFHQHPDILVFDEHACNEAFTNYRLRELDHIRKLIAQSRFQGVCFKPICDSHRVSELHSTFPTGHFIWLYRNYRDVANSSLRKFEDPTRAILLVCTGQSGGGWFQDGVSRLASITLQEIYRPSFSDFDLACLAWWARNQIILESDLIGETNVTTLNYETLATNPAIMVTWMFNRIGIDCPDRIGKHISTRSIGRSPAPPLNTDVQALCEQCLAALDAAFQTANPPITI